MQDGNNVRFVGGPSVGSCASNTWSTWRLPDLPCLDLKRNWSRTLGLNFLPEKIIRLITHTPLAKAGMALTAGLASLPQIASRDALRPPGAAWSTSVPASCVALVWTGGSHGMAALRGGKRAAAGAFRLWSGRRGGVASPRAAWKQEVLWAEAPVADVGLAAEELFHLALDVSGNKELMEGYTKPGQFVQVRVGDSKPAFLAMSSPPQLATKGVLEFLVKDVDGSTAALLCHLGRGDRVELSQVMGSGFNMERVSPAEQFPTLLLFATGSGISPIRALLESGMVARRQRGVRLFYGARNLDRMAFQDRFKEWEASGVQIVPVLSQPGPGDAWDGEQGYVQAAFSRSKGIVDAAQCGAVLCGHKGMTQEVTALLVDQGVPKERILLNF